MTNFVVLASSLFDLETDVETLDDDENAIYARSQETFISQLQIQSDELSLNYRDTVAFKVSVNKFEAEF